jgi:hypothetical protein
MANIKLDSIVIDSNTILSIFAIIISFLGVYYTRKQILMPLIWETKKTHMLDLKNYLNEWKNDLPLHESSYNFIKEWTNHGYRYSLSTRSIWPYWPENESQLRLAINRLEADWRFEDLTESHLPKDCQDLKEIWKNYKNLIYDHEKKFYNLYINVMEIIVSELDKLKIDYKTEVDWRQDKRCFILLSGFVQSLMLQYLFYYMPKEKQYEGTLAYSKEFVYLTSNNLFVRIINHPTHLAEGSESELQEIRILFEMMAFSNSYILRYKHDIIELMEIEALLMNNCSEMLKIISKLLGYPTLPSKKCTLLKIVDK